MMAASPTGSKPPIAPACVSALEPGRAAAPAPRAELSSTKVAISSGTRFAAEGCAPCADSIAVSGLGIPVAVPLGRGPGPGPEVRAIEAGRPALPGSALGRSAPGKLALTRSGPEEPGIGKSRPPRPGTGQSAASPSEGKSPAGRFDLALRRIVGLARIVAAPK